MTDDSNSLYAVQSVCSSWELQDSVRNVAQRVALLQRKRPQGPLTALLPSSDAYGYASHRVPCRNELASLSASVMQVTLVQELVRETGKRFMLKFVSSGMFRLSLDAECRNFFCVKVKRIPTFVTSNSDVVEHRVSACALKKNSEELMFHLSWVCMMLR